MSEASSGIRFDSAKCTGCGRCVAACVLRLISLDQTGFRKHAGIKLEKLCTRCNACVQSCLFGAINTDFNLD